jgi:hypothetical protein
MMQNDSRYSPLTIKCDQEDNKEKPTCTTRWFCWENYGRDCIENRPHRLEKQYCEHQQSNTVSTNDSCYIPISGIHSERQYYNCYPDVPCAAGGGSSYYYNEEQQYPRQYHSSKSASSAGSNDAWHSNPYKIQNSYHRPDLYLHTSSGQKEHGGGRTQSAPLYFHNHYKNTTTPSTINNHCHHLTAPPPPSAINSQQQQEQYQQHAVNSRAVTSSFTTPAFYKYPHPSNDDHGGNYNKYNKEFVEDQPQTSRKKRKSKPAAHESRRPLSAYNFFFSEEKEFVVALLPDRSYTVHRTRGIFMT